MRLNDFFSATREKFPKVPNGESRSIAEFFSKCNGMVWLPTHKVAEWHRMLTSYSDPNKNNRLLVRLYEGVKNRTNNSLETRRGAITRMSDGYEYVFTSNYFARVIYSMIYWGCDVPNEEDFADMIYNRRVCISFPLHVNPGEQEISAYPSRVPSAEYSTKGFYTPDWYLAHIADVNNVKNVPYRGREGIRPCDLITPGTYDDWRYFDGMVIRKEDRKFTQGEKSLIRAHFLRFLDPINYFLVPRSKQESHEGGNKLGEIPNVVAYAKWKMITELDKISPEIYDDFCDKALIPKEKARSSDIEQTGRVQLYVRFASTPIFSADIKRKRHQGDKTHSAKPTASVIPKMDEDLLCEVVRAYLECGKSYRLIEHEILGMDFQPHGGGFVAQTILRGLKISPSEKGVLSRIAPQEFIENCGDPLHSILIKIYGGK